MQQIGDFLSPDGIALGREFFGQAPHAFTSPAQGRLRIAPTGWLDQGFQGYRQVGVFLNEEFASTARVSDAPYSGPQGLG